MALSSKITTIYIRNIADTWSYNFTTSNFTSDLGQVNFTEAFDEAIDGSLRSNLRGYRLSLRLNWDKLHDSIVSGTGITVGAFLNSLRTTFASDGDSYIEISFNDGAGDAESATPNWFKVIPENLNYSTSYTNQIGRGSASLEFRGQEIITSIPSTLEAPSL